MKKSKIFISLMALLFVLMTAAPKVVTAQDGCGGCWWNDVDMTCCENGSMCCGYGGCGTVIEESE